VSGNKSYAQNSARQGKADGERSQQQIQKFNFFLIIHFSNIIFFSVWKVFIHSTWICYEKVNDNFVFWAIRVSS